MEEDRQAQQRSPIAPIPTQQRVPSVVAASRAPQPMHARPRGAKLWQRSKRSWWKLRLE